RPDRDAGRAIQQMELVAWSEGLGTCFVGLRQIEQMNEVKELLGIPAEMQLITLLPFGYREEGFKSRGTTRKPMSDMVHYEKFGEKR
ncbi:MAG: nitroreductase family protein, partial [Chloroflexi bacterium]|nr:nitroreductase family protein [Chloroflexota bacterium]